VLGSRDEHRESDNLDARMKEKIIGFFTDVVKEMNKVTWPKKDDLRDSTVIVLVVCLIIAGFVYVVDTAVSTGLRLVLEFFKG
jgi:preprotein translocase subunit SecE